MVPRQAHPHVRDLQVPFSTASPLSTILPSESIDSGILRNRGLGKQACDSCGKELPSMPRPLSAILHTTKGKKNDNSY